MTTRELTIIKAVLDYLHSLDGGQADEFLIHRDIYQATDPVPSAAELKAVLAQCDAMRWITGVPAKFTRKMKWNLNDAGEAARLEM
jgi:hypothetical protein